MSRAERAFFAGAAALIGFALAYALPIYARLPNLFYDPVARRWAIARTMGPIPMGYYGLFLWGLGGALVVGGITWIATAGRRAPSDRAFTLAAAWALTVPALVLAWFAWNNWP